MASTGRGIFISHIHEEAPLGVVIKAWMADVFHGESPFLSTDKQSLPAGSKWLREIERQLVETRVMISVLSPLSLARPWVNIELGAAWIRGVTIIPLCHSGLKADELPRPFDDFTALTLDDNNSAKDLIAGTAIALGRNHSQKLAFAEFRTEMLQAAGKSQPGVAPAPVRASPELHPDQIAILQVLADFADHVGASEYAEAPVVAGAANLKQSVFAHHAEQLERLKLIDILYYTGGPGYKITGKGTGWLLENDLLPK